MATMNVRPIDTARAGRYAVALIDNNTEQAVAAFNEAAAEGTVDLMMNAVAGHAIGFLRLAAKGNDDAVKQLFVDLILKARLDDGPDEVNQ